jgi:hypothetical protein
MREVVGAVLNYQTVLRQLWPLDWTADILLRALYDWDYLSIVTVHKTRVRVFGEIFNSVLYRNSVNLDKGPMSYEELIKVWKSILAKHGVMTQRPHVFKFMTPIPERAPLPAPPGKQQGKFGDEKTAKETVGKLIRNRFNVSVYNMSMEIEGSTLKGTSYMTREIPI